MKSREAIPMIDLSAPHGEIEQELFEGFAEVVSSGRFVLGEPVEAFETALAKLCETRHAVACNSGTDALWLALRSLDVGPGDAVLCPAYSFFATAATIVRLGARPVFVDIDRATLNLDPLDAMARAEGVERLRAVVSVDLFGRLCELGPLEGWCAERGIPIVEDAAQSIGAVDPGGRPVGGRTRVACFSFYPTKNLGALGDGGGLVTADPALAARAARLRVHGESAPGVFEEIGLNSRLDALQAVALLVKLRHLERWTRARREHAQRYDALFMARGARAAGAQAETALPVELPPPVQAPGRHTYHRYVVRVPADRRDDLIARLARDAIACEVYYARGLHRQPALAAWAPDRPLVETDRASRETLALPLFPELRPDQIERVVERVCAALEDR
jgi:dTDP-4-amino-4,6-dideoxygalactose transaminase